MVAGMEAKEGGLENRRGGHEGTAGGSHDEDEHEYEELGEVTPPLHSPPPEDLPSPDSLFSEQAGISVGMRQPKHPQMEPGHRSAHRHSLVMCCYLLTHRVCVLR
jgi:hypothetical protein